MDDDRVEGTLTMSMRDDLPRTADRGASIVVTVAPRVRG